MRVSRSVILVVLFIWSPLADAQRAQVEGNVEALNISVSFMREAQGELIQWARKEERLGAKYVRLRFKDIVDNSSSDYRVVVRDRNGRPVESFTKTEFGTKQDFWTSLIEGDYVRVEVIASIRPNGLSFKLGEIAYQQNMGAPFSISIPDEREPIIKYQNEPDIFARGRSVAKLTFINSGFSSMCTGFLIDEDRMVTNEHCINSKETCSSAVAIFGFQVNEVGSVSFGEQFRCTELLDVDAVLDFALIRLAGKPGTVWGKLELTRRAPTLNEQFYMIQHPAGEPKQISRKGCSATTAVADGLGPGTDIGHKCDTLGGSSGSPILGRDFKVVALHHFGFAASGRWRDENRAVRIERIMDRLNLP